MSESISWKLKLACVWGGELVSVLTSSILQMGFVWHITLTTNSASMLSLASLAGFLPLALFGTFAGAIAYRVKGDRFFLSENLGRVYPLRAADDNLSQIL